MKKLLLALIILTSCVTKKKYYTEKDLQTKIDSVKLVTVIHKTDTIKLFKEKIVTKPIQTFIEIPTDCDENGKVKELEYKVQSGNNKIKAILKDNKLIIEGLIDSTKTTTEKLLKSSYERKIDSLTNTIKETSTKETKKETIKQRHWFFTHLQCMVVLFLLLYLFIRYYIKS